MENKFKNVVSLLVAITGVITAAGKLYHEYNKSKGVSDSDSDEKLND